jgi:cytochrome c oxidase subunit 2
MEKILGLPELASKHGRDVDDLIIYMHILMGLLFIGWFIYFCYALIRFRKKANPKADYVGIRGHMSSWIELAVAIAEGVLLLGVAVPGWARAVDSFPTAADHPVVVKIIAQQFNWNVFYPGADGEFGRMDASLVSSENVFGADPADPKGKDDFMLNNDLHVVVDKPVIIYLSSKDVIHSFKVLAMRVTQDAIPGMRIPLHFTPTKVGVYQINCAQLCGNGHSNMGGGRLTVQTQADYDKWMAGKVKTGSGATSFE